MSHYEEIISLDLPGDVDDAAERLREFYEHNGYVDELADQDKPIRLTRGKSGAGWWSSQMTQLDTVLTIDVDDSGATLTYRVDTTGQHLSDDDQEFWLNEADRAGEYARGDAELIDLRPLEEERAKEVKEEFRRIGVWATAAVFFIVFVFGIIADRFGWL